MTRKEQQVFDLTETVHIKAPAETVWNTLQDIETWWLASNPEHHSIERLDDRGIAVGAQLRIREKVAGIPGEAIGVITHVTPRNRGHLASRHRALPVARRNLHHR